MAKSGIISINLLTLRPGASVDDFARFSAELDQPTCLAQDVVVSFDAYAVRGREPGAPAIDVVEAMHVRSWDEWVQVRDELEEMKRVVEVFDTLVAPGGVRTLFASRIPRHR